VCSRCEGYEHVCIWSEDKRDRSQKLDSCSPTGITLGGLCSPSSSQSASSLHAAIQSYEKLISRVRLDLPESSRAAVDLTLSYIRLRLPVDEIGLETANSIPATKALQEYCPQNVSPERIANRRRYLGEASDVRFFHSIKKILRDEDLSGGAAETDIQSYDQGVLLLEKRDGLDIYTDLPTRGMADTYVDIYFFTIHIAYPFICKPSFMALYERYWDGDLEVNENSSWLPLMCKSRTRLKSIQAFPHQI
jgi:hypothetical protein